MYKRRWIWVYEDAISTKRTPRFLSEDEVAEDVVWSEFAGPALPGKRELARALGEQTADRRGIRPEIDPTPRPVDWGLFREAIGAADLELDAEFKAAHEDRVRALVGAWERASERFLEAQHNARPKG